MRAVSACLLFVVAAALASAQSCTAPSSDPLNPSSTSGCNLIQACQSSLCACTGSSGSYSTCLKSNTGSCTATQSCYAAYFQCLTATTTTRSNTSNTACSNYVSTLYIAQLSAAASTSAFNTTSLYSSCAYDVCTLLNSTGNTGSCSSTTVVAAVCNSANLLGSATTTVAPGSSSTPAPSYDIVVTLPLSGANWSYILANATLTAQLTASLQSDLAALLGVSTNFIVIISLTIGSLVVSFGVLTGSGKSPAQLNTAITAASSSTSWLTSTSAVYSKVGTDGITSVSVTVTQTAAPTSAPGGSTPAPTSSAMSAAGVAVVAAVASIAALLA